ncbi:glycosyltransferase family 4 protein [Promethearchaeum syntrophicum]|uniref:Glycosyltransferase family 4 protein n=1 Tax=Promethearchaeum syntrophicum TaxID=2594042 RepID=A0A5B9D6T0_9ARCH|nr:glycosyltransferase family 4 protein [Candidatus Prometheoarchaeum syntrophicum]QEE14829.1 Trehalose synthase [Candidatus Prometheoarchaeum syntrophicum]
MKILLFPTRFFPAISGGDFYLQRLGKEFLKINKVNLKQSQNQILFLTTNALDFGALHGKGKIIVENHRYYEKFENLSIKRFKSSQNNQKNGNFQENFYLQELCSKYLGLSHEISEILIKNGPILRDLDKLLLSKQFEKILPFKPDVIHCTYLPYSNLLYSLIIAKYFNIPSIVTPFLHDSNLRYQNQEIFEILKKFDKIIACTNHEKNLYISNGIKEEKIHVFPMGIDINRFQKDCRSDFLKYYSIKSPILLFCGHKNYEKGALTILDTIPLVIKKYPNISFIFIGSPTKAFNYKYGKIRKNYPSLQFINISPDNLSGIFDPQKIGAFQLTDIFCMPSRSDAYGIVYLEAWACKKPVIGVDNDSMREVIEHEKDGILVKFDDVEDLKNAIINLLKNPKKRKEMGENGFLKVSNLNNWNEIGIKTMQIYTQIRKTSKNE